MVSKRSFSLPDSILRYRLGEMEYATVLMLRSVMGDATNSTVGRDKNCQTTVLVLFSWHVTSLSRHSMRPHMTPSFAATSLFYWVNEECSQPWENHCLSPTPSPSHWSIYWPVLIDQCSIGNVRGRKGVLCDWELRWINPMTFELDSLDYLRHTRF